MSNQLSKCEQYVFDLKGSLENANKFFSEINVSISSNLTQAILQNAKRTIEIEIPDQINNIISLNNRCNPDNPLEHVLDLVEAHDLVKSAIFLESINRVMANTEIIGFSPLKNMNIGSNEILSEILEHIKTSEGALRLTVPLSRM